MSVKSNVWTTSFSFFCVVLNENRWFYHMQRFLHRQSVFIWSSQTVSISDNNKKKKRSDSSVFVWSSFLYCQTAVKQFYRQYRNFRLNPVSWNIYVSFLLLCCLCWCLFCRNTLKHVLVIFLPHQCSHWQWCLLLLSLKTSPSQQLSNCPGTTYAAN